MAFFENPIGAARTCFSLLTAVRIGASVPSAVPDERPLLAARARLPLPITIRKVTAAPKDAILPTAFDEGSAFAFRTWNAEAGTIRIHEPLILWPFQLFNESGPAIFLGHKVNAAARPGECDIQESALFGVGKAAVGRQDQVHHRIICYFGRKAVPARMHIQHHDIIGFQPFGRVDRARLELEGPELGAQLRKVRR
jgi:hypothetical protein